MNHQPSNRKVTSHEVIKNECRMSACVQAALLCHHPPNLQREFAQDFWNIIIILLLSLLLILWLLMMLLLFNNQKAS